MAVLLQVAVLMAVILDVAVLQSRPVGRRDESQGHKGRL